MYLASTSRRPASPPGAGQRHDHAARHIVPTAVNERAVAADLLEAGLPPRDLSDKAFNGVEFAAEQAARGTAIFVPPTWDERRSMQRILQKVIAEWRNLAEAASARSPT